MEVILLSTGVGKHHDLFGAGEIRSVGPLMNSRKDGLTIHAQCGLWANCKAWITQHQPAQRTRSIE